MFYIRLVIIIIISRGNMPYDTDPSTVYYNVDSPTDATCKNVHVHVSLYKVHVHVSLYKDTCTCVFI